SSDLLDFLAAHARPELPIVVDLDPVRWRLATGVSELSGEASPGRLVVTGLESGADGQRITGFAPDGEPGTWPAAWVVAGAHRPHPETQVDEVTLHQPLVRRRLEVDPARIIRYGL